MDLSISTFQRIAIIVTFVLYTLAVVGVALYAKRKMDQSSVNSYVEDFYTGGRGMGMLAVAFMIAAGLCGAGTFVGSPGMSYKVGGPWILVSGCQIFVTFVVLGEIGKKIGIVARRIDAQSYLDLIAHRFNYNRGVILLGGLSITLFMLTYVVGQTVGGARVFEAMTGLPYWMGLVFFAVTVLLVTALGGVKGVALAIIVQGIAMTFAVLCLIVGSHIEVTQNGGWEALSRAIHARDPSYFDPFRWSIPYEFSQWIIYGFAAISLPHLAMGALTYKNTIAMKRAVILGIVIVTVWTIGLGLYCSLAAKGLYPNLQTVDHAVPILTMQVVPSWLAGITLAGVASAVQSTVGAIIIVISSTIVLNLWKFFFKPKATADEQKKMTIVTTVLISVVVFFLALNPPDLLQLIITFSMGGMAAAFFFTMLLGCYWRRCNEWGAAFGIAGAYITYLVAEMKWLPFDITLGMHPVGISLLVSLTLLVVVSLVTPKPPKGVIMTWYGKDYPMLTD